MLIDCCLVSDPRLSPQLLVDRHSEVMQVQILHQIQKSVSEWLSLPCLVLTCLCSRLQLLPHADRCIIVVVTYAQVVEFALTPFRKMSVFRKHYSAEFSWESQCIVSMSPRHHFLSAATIHLPGNVARRPDFMWNLRQPTGSIFLYLYNQT